MIPRSILNPIYRIHRKITLLVIGVISLGILVVGLAGYIVYDKAFGLGRPQAVASHVVAPNAPVVRHTSYNLENIKKMYTGLMEKKAFIGEGIYVVAWDRNANKFYDIYGKNIDAPYNAASVTKLMTALTLAEQGLLTHDLLADSDEEPIGLPEGEASGDFRGQTFPQADLVAAMLIQSSNQAAYSLVRPTGMSNFVDKMNAEARKIGMSRTILRDPSGYDFGRKNQASYMSPRDVVRAAFKLASEYPEVIKLSANNTFDITNTNGRKFTLRNTNPLVQKTDNVILSKTGYTNLAGGNLAMVTEPRPGILVGYVTMHSTKDGRFTDMDSLVGTMKTVFDLYDVLAKPE